MSQRRGAMRGDYISRLSSNGNKVNKMFLWRLFKTQRSRCSAIGFHLHSWARFSRPRQTTLCLLWIHPLACRLCIFHGFHINCTHLSNDVSLASLSCTHMLSVVRLTFWKLLSFDTRWNHLKKTIYVMFTLLPDSFPLFSPFTKTISDRASAQTKTAILARIL